MYAKMNYFDAFHPDVLIINQWKFVFYSTMSNNATYFGLYDIFRHKYA